jgi:hypothetical protein
VILFLKGSSWHTGDGSAFKASHFAFFGGLAFARHQPRNPERK